MLALANKLTTSTQPIYRFVNKYSIDFDGVDDCIVTDGADTVAQNTTYSFWCKSSQTGQNYGVFGHGNYNMGAFRFNYAGDRPLLFLGTNYFRLWNDTPAQDDGEWHHWVVYLATNLTDSKLYVDGVLQTVNSTTSSGSLEAYTESLTIGGDEITGGNYFEGQIDEFAVYDRELTQAEITRMYNTYYSPNRVANGNFSQIGNEEVTNGDFSQIGSEEVTNGDFATDSDWTKHTGITISNGKANFNNVALGGRLQQNFSFTNGKAYKIVVVLSSLTSGRLGIFMGGTYMDLNLTAEGTYTYYHTPTSGTEFFFRVMDSGTTASIDNVSVKEVGQDWSLVGDFEIDDTKAFITSASQYSQITSQQGTSFLTNGKTYKLEADITTSITNALAYRVQGGAVTPISTSDIVGGKYTAYFTMTQDGYFWFQTTGAYTGLNATIDNVSVKEVGQHWTFGTGWSTDGTKAIGNITTFVNLVSNASVTSGKTYKVDFTILDYISGSLDARIGGTTGTSVTANGTYSQSIVAGSSDTQAMFRTGAFVGSIDNIVVQELKHDATNLMLNHSEYQSANPLITSTKSMEFDGTDNFLKVEDSANLRGMAALTVCCWVKFDTKSNYAKVLDYSSTSGNSQRKYRIQVNNATDQKIQFLIANTSDSTSTITSTDAMPTGRWVHLVGAFDNSLSSNRQSFYIDGVLDNTATAFTETINNDDSGFLSFGENTYGSNNFDGKITEAGIYNRALTALEVASLYNQGVPTDLLVSRGDYVATGLQGYWKMGDGTNDEYPVIYDQVDPTNSAELVTNGDFATDSDWTKGTGWSIGGGVAISDGSSGYSFLQQTSSVLNGKTYKISYSVTSYTSGSVEVGVGGTSNNNIQRNLVGDFVEYHTSNGTNLTIISRNLIGSIDNVSVKEVQGNPATMTNMVEGNITNQFPLTKIRNYYRMGDGILDGYPIIQDQTSPNLAHIPTTNIVLNSSFTTSSTWVLSNATIDTNTNKATVTITGGGFSQIRQSLTYTSGKQYTVSATINGTSGKEMRFVDNGSNTGGLTTSNGVVAMTGSDQNIKITWTANANSNEISMARNTGSGDYSFTISNVQVEAQSQATAYIKSDGIAAVRKATTTNLVNYSEDFSQSYWSKINGVTVTSSTIISPDGVSLAQGLQFDGTDNGRIEVNVGSYSNLTQSVYLKVASGTASVQIGFTGGSQLTVTVTNEWQRFEYFQASGTFPRVRCNDNKLIYVWGLQVEEQTQAETYAKTTGLPVEIDLFTQNSYGTMTNMSASDIIEDTPNN